MILYYKTMSKYNIIINSNSRLGTSSNSSNHQYTFDWSTIPDEKYELSFSFTSAATAHLDTITVSLPDLGVSRNIFTTSISTGQSFSSVIGAVRSVQTGSIASTNIYYASVLDNPSIYIKSTPKSNNFNVILFNINTLLPYDIEANYSLILSLKSIN
jgi:hypothetical protein